MTVANAFLLGSLFGFFLATCLSGIVLLIESRRFRRNLDRKRPSR